MQVMPTILGFGFLEKEKKHSFNSLIEYWIIKSIIHWFLVFIWENIVRRNNILGKIGETCSFLCFICHFARLGANSSLK